MDFARQPPPHFRGMDPHRRVDVYRRHLPHWRQAGATYFITFRLNDSLPQSKLDSLRELRWVWEQNHPEPRSELDWTSYAKQYTRLAERWLDEGHGECWLRQTELAHEVRAALEYFQDERLMLSSYVIMPNHVHATVKPLGDYGLEAILGGWKGFTARRINQRIGRTGSRWEQEAYDRIVRDAEHLYRVVQYIGNNPGRAGIPEAQWVRWVHPEWERHGWGFEPDLPGSG